MRDFDEWRYGVTAALEEAKANISRGMLSLGRSTDLDRQVVWELSVVFAEPVAAAVSYWKNKWEVSCCNVLKSELDVMRACFSAKAAKVLYQRPRRVSSPDKGMHFHCDDSFRTVWVRKLKKDVQVARKTGRSRGLRQHELSSLQTVYWIPFPDDVQVNKTECSALELFTRWDKDAVDHNLMVSLLTDFVQEIYENSVERVGLR